MSHCYLLKSYANLDEKQLLLAVQEVKLSHYYAQFADAETKSFVEYNAKLQLVLTFIEMVEIEKAQHYMTRFNWQQDCLGDAHGLLFDAIWAMLSLLQGQTEQGVALYKQLLAKLERSQEVMYSTILMRQMYSTLKRCEQQMEPMLYQELQALCQSIESRFTLKLHAFMEQFATFDGSAIDLFAERLRKNVNVFIGGQRLFEKARQNNYEVSCAIVTVDYEALTDEQKKLFSSYICECRQGIVNEHFMLTKFSKGMIVLMAISNATVIRELEQRLQSYPITLEKSVYLARDKRFGSFYELFNHIFYHELLALDVSLFNQSLA